MMIGSTGRTAAQLLDAVRGLSQLEAFDVDGYAQQLAAELAADAVTLDGVAACDDRARAALAAIDGFAARAMRIRIDHALAADTSVPPTFRTHLATMVTAYERDLDTLRQRVTEVAARVDPGGAARAATVVVDAACAVLAARAQLRELVLGAVRDLAAARVAAVRLAARDPGLDDAARARWTAVRRELELVATQPERVAAGRFADRIAALPAIDEPADADEPPSREQLIELD
jgi:hypothetical protein